MAPKKNISVQPNLIDWYRKLCIPRAIENRMLKLLRQNKISKWFSGIGQEAISVGAVLACSKNDYLLPMHRNLGVFTSRGVPYYPLFCQLFGKADGFSKGRERSFHFGIAEHNIIGMISHLAAMLPVACGVATSAKLNNQKHIALAFCGDGATSEGDFHEALNLAAVWNLPVIFLIENNGYGLSTPVSEQYACKKLSDRAAGYGMKGLTIDGNDLFEVYKTVSEAREYAISEQKPVLIEALTFRMRGHEEASGTAYVPNELMTHWAKQDPVSRFRNFLLSENIADEEALNSIENEAQSVFTTDLKNALNATDPEPDSVRESEAVFKMVPQIIIPKQFQHAPEQKEQRFIDSIRQALYHSFTDDESFVLMGQDIAEYGGVFKVTEGFLQLFGKARIRNTPITESGIIGAAVGMAMTGYKPVVEMQFSDFITCGYNQIVNNLGKSKYRWSDALNVTIRAPHGAGVGAGPFHSASPEAWFMQHPGLKVVVPATIQDAYELSIASLYDPNPVLIFEHKKLYRSLKGEFKIPEKIPSLGKARVHRVGEHVSIITYGMGVHQAEILADHIYAEQHISTEILDLRTLWPLDSEAIETTVRKTGRVLLLQESTPVLGPMSEVSAIISERCFDALDAPPMRCSAMHTPVPVNKILEASYLPWSRMRKQFEKLLMY